MAKKLIVFSLFFVFVSCQTIHEEVTSWLNIENGDEIEGKYHFLDDNGVKVFLPLFFEKISISEYQRQLAIIEDDEQRKFEINRVNNLKDSEGDLYLFKDKESGTVCYVKTLPFMPLTRNEAKQFLGLMRIQQERALEGTEFSYERITAKYNGNISAYTFKAINKIEIKNVPNPIYTSFYIVTANNKTLMVNLSTPNQVFFDPFIEKTVM